MVIEFDEKGKYFTEVISKNEIIAHIQTQNYLIRGCVHVRTGERLSDEINGPNAFLAVTSADIYNPEGVLLYSSDFLVVNRAHIVWMMPIEEDKEKPALKESTDGKRPRKR
jgi:hypothetical protein